jgi:hypothetical protein
LYGGGSTNTAATPSVYAVATAKYSSGTAVSKVQCYLISSFVKP